MYITDDSADVHAFIVSNMIRKRTVITLLCILKCPTAIYALLSGYDYPIPPITPPPQLDEPFIPPQVVPTYLPPSVYPPLSPGIDVQPPLFDPGDTVVIPEPPSNQYLPPSNQYLPPSNQYLPPSTQYLPPATRTPQMRVLNMTCLEGNFFRSVLHLSDLSNVVPVIEDRTTTNGCIVRDSSSSFRLEADGSLRMRECGIKRCDNKLCATVRLPTVSGLQLPEDQLITLQCTPQQSVISHVKQVRIGLPKLIQGRASSRAIPVAAGGSQRRFDTQVVLLRKTPGSHDFDQPVHSGGAVHLGEELLLRSIVRDGDGWRYSRMGPVIVRSASTPRSITLVDESGCRPIQMRSVCPEHPRQVGPLVTSLPMRAFLFQDAVQGDNMLLTVRMLACLNPFDCYKGKDCHDGDLDFKSRVKRDEQKASNQTADDEHYVTNFESSFEFRVVADDKEEKLAESSTKDKSIFRSSTPLVGLAIFGISGCIICFVITVLKLKKSYY